MKNFSELISGFLLSKPKARKLPPKKVAKRLGVRKRDYAQFLEAWDATIAEFMTSEKRSARRDRAEESEAAEALPSRAGCFHGVIRKVGVNGATCSPTAGPVQTGAKPLPEAVLIAPADLKDAQAGDEVLVQLTSRRGPRGQRCGRVVEVVERATNTFVGTYDEFDGQGYVKIDGRNFADPIWVGDPGAKGARPGDKVVIEMLRFPTHARAGEAVLTQVLGEKGQPGVDVLTIIHEFGLPDAFTAEVFHAASEQAERFDENDLRGRRDLTGETIITIDPADARDFDDAISLAKNDAGNWQLGVHIADVAHFVPLGGELDREARRRGTSVYLPTRVIPMLPEVISNGLASLQQGRVRYTNSVFIEFTPEGVPLDVEFAKTAIKVTRRFAYEEVMPILRHPDHHAAKVTAGVRQLLANMHELAMTLRRRRLAAGALDLNLGEVKLDFDADGKVVGAHEAEHDESHQIIEEFMLAANIAVATKFNDLGTAFLRRVHAEPDSLKLQSFAKFVAALGFSVSDSGSASSGTSKPERSGKRRRDQRRSEPTPFDSPVILSREALQLLLKQVRGTPAEHAVNYAMLRSLRQAEYSGATVGHYALAVRDYCHFTSPIRRYPDLTVHRLFDELAAGATPRGPSEVELDILAQHCSDTERRAATAERELTKLKLLAFMAERIGEEMDAVITGVERFGLFCEGIQIPVSGFVHISVLADLDYFDFDQDSLSLVGRRTATRFRLGDRVRVKVVHVEPDRRELDFHIVSDVSERGARHRMKGEKSQTPSQRRRTGEQAAEKRRPEKRSRRRR